MDTMAMCALKGWLFKLTYGPPQVIEQIADQILDILARNRAPRLVDDDALRTAISATAMSAAPGNQVDAAVNGIRTFIEDLGLPTRLRDVDVGEGPVPTIAKHAMADMVVAFSPATVDATSSRRAPKPCP